MLPYILTNVSIVFWILPVFRQYKEDYFYFFLVIAITDPIAGFCYYLKIIPITVVHSVSSLLLFYSIDIANNKLLENKVFNLILFVSFCFVLLAGIDRYLVIAILHSFVLVKFIKISAIKMHYSGKINLFYLVFILYELSIVVKMSFAITRTELGNLYYTITLAFEMLIAIFFTIYRENNPKIIFNLKSTSE